MDKLARELPVIKLLMKFRVFEKINIKSIAKIREVRRFKNAGSIIVYPGLDTLPYQSGHFKATNRHISKCCNKYLRKTGYESNDSHKK